MLTEMWERMAYYGLRTILVLFLVAPAAAGGFAMDDKSAALVYALLVSLFTFLGMFAGWIGDNVLGTQRAILVGGGIIIVGLALTILPAAGFVPTWVFFLGLWIDVIGIALLKTNAPALLNQLYSVSDADRDAGFFLYYMGISVGTLLGTALIPLVADLFGWAWGFLAALVGMLIGVVQFALTRRRFDGMGAEPCGSFGETRRWLAGLGTVAAFLAVTLCAGAALAFGVLDLASLAHTVSGSYFALTIAFLAYLLFVTRDDADARKRILAMIPIGFGASLFVIGFDQAGSSLNLFAQRFTDRVVAGFEIPAGLFQSAYPIGIIILAPLVTIFWSGLARRGMRPTVLTQFGAGLVFMASGFLVMYFAARSAEAHGTTMPVWLLTTYLLHTLGDLCVGPVGISAATRIAPRQLVAQFVGLWQVGLSIGHSISGYVAAGMDTRSLPGMASGFHKIFVMGMAGAALVFILSPLVRRLLGPKIEF